MKSVIACVCLLSVMGCKMQKSDTGSSETASLTDAEKKAFQSLVPKDGAAEFEALEKQYAEALSHFRDEIKESRSESKIDWMSNALGYLLLLDQQKTKHEIFRAYLDDKLESFQWWWYGTTAQKVRVFATDASAKVAKGVAKYVVLPATAVVGMGWAGISGLQFVLKPSLPIKEIALAPIFVGANLYAKNMASGAVYALETKLFQIMLGGSKFISYAKSAATPVGIGAAILGGGLAVVSLYQQVGLTEATKLLNELIDAEQKTIQLARYQLQGLSKEDRLAIMKKLVEIKDLLKTPDDVFHKLPSRVELQRAIDGAFDELKLK